jgi:hypothetical protein
MTKIFKLPYIAREVLYLKILQGCLSGALGLDAKFTRAFLQKELGQQRDILAPFP